ncbi:hypothetical protein [Hansschlegelia zhihuaiae]|uniref:Uncharacterized protein n=1 Tax=Hansschlegelia zhihuaiae TaxID=405005 RepID=A0A4Q0MK45_9HYPH|nr:hypothetical protein [Hansschlegelia zhihuaiae]RXF74117.1 hypothetical protein EK403_07025 [Hansschlegelia zhihuaiae]
MSIDKILAEQGEWLKAAAGATTRPDKSAVAIGMPLEIRKRRTEELKARVEVLEAQKEAVVKRYDAAIADEKAEIELLARDIAWDAKGPTPPRDPRRPEPKAASRAASGSAGAAARKKGRGSSSKRPTK